MKINYLTAAVITAAALIFVTGCSGKTAENEVELETADSEDEAAEVHKKAAALLEETTEQETHSSKETEDGEEEEESVSETQKQDSVSKSSDSDVRMVLPLEPMAQGAELPTGCEITSLTMALNYYSLDADKFDLADNYLEKGPVGTVDFRKAFVGDPRDGNSYGCYAPVIVNTAEKYLKAHNSELTASDLTGTDFKDLFEYIKNYTPVIVWGTLDCNAGHYSVTWNVDGRDLTWYTPEHCMVLCGYDYESNEVWVGDPMNGDIRSYDMDLFETRYNELQKQAVVIK
ncbi:MAG: C39 family peptidase [Clostridiales bacterium]|nr:C39 family peptidase [Clostridiales bacterium]